MIATNEGRVATYAVTALLVVAVLAFDFAAPLGVGVWALYLAPLAYFGARRPANETYGLCGFLSALILAGYFKTDSMVPAPWDLVNRGVALVTITGAAVALVSRMRAFALLDEQREALEGSVVRDERAAALERAALELEQANATIAEASRLKSEFIAAMSHELRTPLNGILGFTELLSDGKVGPVTPAQQEYLGDILDSGRHLLSLINDVLDLARVEAGRIELKPAVTDLEGLFDEVMSTLTPMVEQKRIRLRIDVLPEVREVSVDPGKLRQVLLNYLSNAVKFTPEEGRVEMRVVPDGQRAFRVEVEDTGIGIAEEDLGLLFREFQQIEGGTNRTYQGSGLGLALTKRLVVAMGGTVGVRSERGRGSVFSATLPRVAAEASHGG